MNMIEPVGNLHVVDDASFREKQVDHARLEVKINFTDIAAEYFPVASL